MSVGLVSEGGGMRGAYTSGVLDVLLQYDLEFPVGLRDFGWSLQRRELCFPASRAGIWRYFIITSSTTAT